MVMGESKGVWEGVVTEYMKDSPQGCVKGIRKVCQLGETSKFTGCSSDIQQPAAANLYSKSYT